MLFSFELSNFLLINELNFFDTYLPFVFGLSRARYLSSSLNLETKPSVFIITILEINIIKDSPPGWIAKEECGVLFTISKRLLNKFPSYR